jgi:hypothetical protein
MIPAALVVFILGIVTLGIAWFLYGGLLREVALGYIALTPRRPQFGDGGHRWAGVELRTADGAPPTRCWRSCMR